MEESARYQELCRRGRDVFMREAAGAALVRARGAMNTAGSGRDDADSTIVAGEFDLPPPPEDAGFEIYPLAKKPGAPFSDMITVGRTANNDVVFNDVTISRFHAYLKGEGRQWKLCDAGSKNGTCIAGKRLDARKETAVQTGAQIAFGDIEVTFYTAAALYELLASA